ncbi:MAG: hypothetical protein AAF709_04380, partial [Pseudomonadota bacterium]
LIFTAANAQTSGKGKQLVGDQFQRIELDRNDPEVQAIEKHRPLGLFQSNVFHRDNRFLVDLDRKKLPAAVSDSFAQWPNGDRAAASRKRVSYNRGGAGATEFVIEYPALNAQLRCYWSYNRRLADLLVVADAKAREAKLERDARRRARTGQRPGGASPDREDENSSRSQLLISGDREMGTLIRVRRQFKKAGRPCQIDVVCASHVSRNAAFAKRIRLFQKERKACLARADQLADAMRIVRTGK